MAAPEVAPGWGAGRGVQWAGTEVLLEAAARVVEAEGVREGEAAGLGRSLAVG